MAGVCVATPPLSPNRSSHRGARGIIQPLLELAPPLPSEVRGILQLPWPGPWKHLAPARTIRVVPSSSLELDDKGGGNNPTSPSVDLGHLRGLASRRASKVDLITAAEDYIRARDGASVDAARREEAKKRRDAVRAQMALHPPTEPGAAREPEGEQSSRASGAPGAVQEGALLTPPPSPRANILSPPLSPRANELGGAGATSAHSSCSGEGSDSLDDVVDDMCENQQPIEDAGDQQPPPDAPTDDLALILLGPGVPVLAPRNLNLNVQAPKFAGKHPSAAISASSSRLLLEPDSPSAGIPNYWVDENDMSSVYFQGRATGAGTPYAPSTPSRRTLTLRREGSGVRESLNFSTLRDVESQLRRPLLPRPAPEETISLIGLGIGSAACQCVTASSPGLSIAPTPRSDVEAACPPASQLAAQPLPAVDEEAAVAALPEIRRRSAASLLKIVLLTLSIMGIEFVWAVQVTTG